MSCQASREQKELSPGNGWDDNLANSPPACLLVQSNPVVSGQKPHAGVRPGRRAPQVPILGMFGDAEVRGPPQAWLFARYTVSLANGCTWKGQLGGAPLLAQVPVQLCEKCRAWKSLGEIAECLECKHFPGKGGQGT